MPPRLAALASLSIAVWLGLVRLAWDYNLPGGQGDDAAYFHMASHLVETGTLLPMPAYLPGWPMVAAPVIAAGGDIDAVRALSCIFALLSSLLLYRLAAPRLSPRFALVVALSYLFNSVSLRLATTMMSDHCFTFFLFASVTLLDLSESRKLDFCAGLVAGFAGLIRVVALPVAAATALVLLGRRSGRRFLFYSLGVAMAVALAFPILFPYIVRGDDLPKLQASGRQQPVTQVLGAEFLHLQDASQATWAIRALTLCALAGCLVDARRRGIEPIHLMVPAHLAIQLPYPFQVGRYFVWDWPLGVLFLCALAPSLARLRPLLGAALAGVWLGGIAGALSVVDFATRQGPVLQARLASLHWIRDHLPPAATIATHSPERLWLHTRRQPVGIPLSGETFSVYVANMARKKADYVLEEPSTAELSYTHYPARLDLWFERSSLFVKVHQGSFDRLFRWKDLADRERYLKAYALYQKARFAAERNQLEAAQTHCREALAEVEDFPEATLLLAALSLQSSALHQQPPPEEAFRRLEGLLERYPHDINAAQLLASAYLHSERSDDARRILQNALQEGQAQKLPSGTLALVAQMLQKLANSPP